jgi:hypothetical protein
MIDITRQTDEAIKASGLQDVLVQFLYQGQLQQ